MQHCRRREFSHRSFFFALAPGFGKLGYLEAGELECIEERGWEAELAALGQVGQVEVELVDYEGLL